MTDDPRPPLASEAARRWRVGIVGTILGTLGILCHAQIPTLPQQPIPTDIQHAINSVMTVNYGSEYSKVRGCSLYHHRQPSDHGDEAYVTQDSHCIAPIKYETRTVNGESRLYLLVSGYAYDGRVSNAFPGIGGLFELYKSDKSWIMTASNPMILTGGAGRSQLDRFDFVQVGDHKYGWSGKQCSGKGGSSGCRWLMYASLDDKILPIADIELDYHYDISGYSKYHKGEGIVTHEYQKPMSGGFYPLTVTINHTLGSYDSDKVTSSSEERRDYRYNPAKQQFELVK